MKINVRGAIVLCSTLLIALTPISATAVDFGRTTGSFNVSPSGAATYTIPIWTPPGPNGVQPSIALVYSSNAGNGLAGMGWTISAVSSISRCPRTIHQDTTPAAVSMTIDDRFCIDGNRLRLSSGTYGLAGSVYFTEIADYSRVTAYGTVANGPAYFIVEGKNGLRYEYGNTPDSREDLGGSSVLSWYLNKVSDRNGNNYRLAYTSAGGMRIPDTIQWTPTSHGATTYRYEAKFNYDTNRIDLDSIYRGVSGYVVVNRGRLTNIQIKSAGTVVRKYLLKYDPSSTTSRSLLESVTECADDASETSGNCFLPLTFDYQPGMVGLTAGVGTPPASGSNSIYAGRYDFNGDGKDDLAYWSGTTLTVSFGANNGFSTPHSTGLNIGVAIGRFLPNGRDAFATLIANKIHVVYWNDSSGAFSDHNTEIDATFLGGAFDYNGDGLDDFVTKNTNNRNIQIRKNTSYETGSLDFADSVFATASLPNPSPPNSLDAWRYVNIVGSLAGLDYTDLNGDGREDLNVQVIWPGDNPPAEGNIATFTLVATGGGYQVPPTSQWVFNSFGEAPSLHFNGDSCTDRFVNNTVQIAPCGDTWGSTLSAPVTPTLLMDWDGDGKTDILVDSGGTFGVYRSTGNGFSSVIPTSIPSSGTFFDADIDGDGLDDLVRTSPTVSYWTHTASGTAPSYATNIPDLLQTVTDGFGVSTTVNYVSTAWSNYTQGAATSYPLQESGSQIVVARATSSDGIGGTFNRDYSYEGARKHATRRAWVGFQRFASADSRNGLISRTYFDQEFPKGGVVSKTELMQPNGTTTISRSVLTNESTPLDETANNQRHFIFTSGSVATQYEVGGDFNSELLRTVTTSIQFDPASGTPFNHEVTVSEPASANGVSQDESWTTRTYMPVANTINNSTYWCLGRPERTEVTQSHSLTYGDPITRVSATSFNAEYCRATHMVVEPGSGTLEVVTAIGYDSFGNVNSTTVTGAGMAARATTSSYSDGTNTTGQFPLSVTNALGQTSTTTWNYDLGIPTSATDPNGLTTSWVYDAYGRRTRENLADGTYQTWGLSGCTGCPALWKTMVESLEYQTNHDANKRRKFYFDQFDRPIAESLPRAVTGDIQQLREYDALGRVYREYFPYLSSGSDVGYSTTEYDLIDRPKKITRPVSDAPSAPPQDTIISYLGLTTLVTDPQSKNAYRMMNSAGQLVQIEDHDLYRVDFAYDAFGNVKKVQDDDNNILQSSNYNLRGMLTSRTDLDLGAWGFTPNALGETVSQTDAKGQTTSFVFDLLGRVTSRTEAEGTSYFNFGTSAVGKNIGRLVYMSGPGNYSESYSYDGVGRPSITYISADTTYQIDYSYNIAGRLHTITYPSSTGSRLAIQHDYANGFLFRIKDYNAPTTVFWQADDFDARNQVTRETLGNGLVTNRAYDAVTGWLKTIKTGTGANIQDLEYEWDRVGNLKKRIDRKQSALAEEFFYDNLYRMTSSKLDGVPNSATYYNEMGSITSKWDSVSHPGGYSYHTTKKHRLISTTNGGSLSYDDNGNVTSRGGATLDWTSYNYPKCIRMGTDCSGAGTDWSSFSYTPDRQYWKQVSNYTVGGESATFYIGGLLEKVQNSTGTDYRHMIRAGGATIIVSRKSSGSNSVHYVTGDHLGSSSAVTDSSGGILVNSSFEAFGNRRGSTWAGNPSSGDWTAIAGTTRRGYTEHSMLDNLGLIHMNGRVYDPQLGRFLSADPFIPDPMSTQSYNRFSYVQNNPLTLIDPSGFNEVDLTKSAADGVKPTNFDRPRFSQMPPAKCNGSLNFFNCMSFMRDECSSYGCLSNLYLGGGSIEGQTQSALSLPYSGTLNNGNFHCLGCDRTLVQRVLPFTPGIVQMTAQEGGNSIAIFRDDSTNPITGQSLTPLEVNDQKFLMAVNAGAPMLGRVGRVANAAKGANVATKQLTVIGHNPNYVRVAQAKGANYLDPSRDWSPQKQGEFMSDVIARGDDVLIAGPLRVGDSVTRHEIKQLIKTGYTPAEPGSLLLIKTGP